MAESLEVRRVINPSPGMAVNGAMTAGLWVNGRYGATVSHPAHALPEELAAPPPPRPVVANQVPALRPDTPMQKVVLPGLVDLTLGNVVVPGRFDPYRIAGFVTRLQDVPASTAADLARRYGLNQVADWPAAADLHVMRFYAHTPALYISPFARNVYQIDLQELPAGAELWRIDATGGEQRVGAYLHRQVGWVSTAPVPLGPGLWNPPPAPLQPTVRRGPAARLHGQEFDADLGPRPGEVTLHPLPGQPPPPFFAEQAGIHTLTVGIGDLDSLEIIRWRAGWRDLPVEIVDSGPDWAVIHYIGENGPRAAELGCAEVDYRVWRGSVPHSDLTDIQQHRVPLRIP